MRSRDTPPLALTLVLLAGCSGEPAPDAGPREDDAGPTALDVGPTTLDAGLDARAVDVDAAPGASDAAPADAPVPTDAFLPPDAFVLPDAFLPPDAFAPPDAGADAGTPPRSDHHIHIEVDNFCRMTVTPREITIPADQTAYFDWHNHSRDYPVDVWMSYGGGYTDLATGATWDEPIGHCGTPFVGDEYADISTACSSFRFLIHCR